MTQSTFEVGNVPTIPMVRPDTGFYAVVDGSGNPVSLWAQVAGVPTQIAPSPGAVTNAGVQPASAVAATNTVTSNNTNVSANDTVTVNGKVYTFKASVSVEGDIKIGASADASLTNLEHAINGFGGTPGTDYQVAAGNPNVSAGAVASHAITLTAHVAGAAGNAFTLAKSAVTLTVGGATFSNGADCTVIGPAGMLLYYSGAMYYNPFQTYAYSTGAFQTWTTTGA